MKHTRLGRTGLQVSRLCLGTMTFGLQCDEPTSRTILDTAAAGGITFIDTANIYGMGISREGSLIDMGVENGIVRKAGAWFTYESDQLGQGKENARKYLKKNPEVADEIEQRILTHLGIGVPSEVPPGIDPVTGEVAF